MERRERRTIMDGLVVEFAEGFYRTGTGIGGDTFEAEGPYRISASRNAVVVHHAELKRDSEVAAFAEALKSAAKEAADLAHRDGYGNYWADAQRCERDQT